MDTLLENILHVLLKLDEFEGYSFYCDVPRVVNFCVQGIQNTKCMLQVQGATFKACLYTHISLMLFVNLPIRCRVKT